MSAAARTPGEVVSAFIHAIESSDWDSLLKLSAPDIVFENVPQDEPHRLTHGPEAIRDRLAVLHQACVNVEFVVLTQIEQGAIVMNERVDTFHFVSGTFPKGDVLKWPVATLWKVRDGQVLLWRDYYDLGYTDKQLGVSLAEFGAIIGREYTASS
jgi:limonene-1,2-epoxide hydrolase